MIISINPIVFDMLGSVVLDALLGSDYGLRARRANKIKTLDGGVAVNDFGYSHADREFSIKIRTDPKTDAALKYLVEFHAQVTVCTNEGVFTAIPSYDSAPDFSRFNLSITGRLD